MRCPDCSGEVALETAKHCPECGAPLPIACGSCGCENAAGSKFCAECGRPLAHAPSSVGATVVASHSDKPAREETGVRATASAQPTQRLEERVETTASPNATARMDGTQTPSEPAQSTNLIAASYVCAVVFPLAGFVLSTITLVRGRLGHGLAALALSISMAFFWMGFVQGFINAVDVQTYVTCQGAVGGMNCAVERRSGDAPATVCWDVKLTCRNGVTATASGCHPVPPGVGAKSTRTIGYSDIRRWDDCDEVESMAVENLRLS